MQGYWCKRCEERKTGGAARTWLQLDTSRNLPAWKTPLFPAGRFESGYFLERFLLLVFFDSHFFGIIRGDQVKIHPQVVFVGLTFQFPRQIFEFLFHPVFKGRKFTQHGSLTVALI